MFASEACFGVVPDMIVTAKGITSGYLPLGATIISDRLYDGLARTRSDGALLAHGFTYSGHAAACAVGLANIALLERERLRTGAGPWSAVSRTAGDAAGAPDRRRRTWQPLHAVPRTGAGPPRKAPFPAQVDIGRRIARAAQERGLIVRPIGNLSVLSPALTLTRDQIERIVATLDASLRWNPA